MLLLGWYMLLMLVLWRDTLRAAIDWEMVRSDVFHLLDSKLTENMAPFSINNPVSIVYFVILGC